MLAAEMGTLKNTVKVHGIVASRVNLVVILVKMTKIIGLKFVANWIIEQRLIYE